MYHRPDRDPSHGYRSAHQEDVIEKPVPGGPATDELQGRGSTDEGD
jgi:hypothetical protein